MNFINLRKIRSFCIHLIITFLSLLFISSCNSENDKAGFIIHGILTNTKSDKLVLEELSVRDVTPIDSASIDENGRFTLKHTPEETGFYILKVGEDNFITLLIENGDDITITADASQLIHTYDIQGSEGSELLSDYYKYTARNKHKVDSLALIFEQSKSSPDFISIRSMLDSSYKEIVRDQQEYVMNFIDSNPGSLASLIVLNKRFGNTFLLSEKENFDYFQKIDSGLMAKCPDNIHAIEHHKRVTEVLRKRKERELADEKLQPGLPAPLLSEPDTSGNEVSLYSLKGKMVLIYFWAAESAPSRQINPDLKKLYRQFSPAGFEIYGVSFDRNPALWKAAIKIDKLDWIQVSDNKGNSSPILKLYNLPEELPYFYLIDKESLILWRGNRYQIDELKDMITTHLR